MGRKELSIAIIGGGIGGLAAALSLLRAGADVHVYEQARTMGEVGAGIQVSPNASCILYRLGLADALANMGVKPLAWHQRRWDDGRTLLRTPLTGAVEGRLRIPALRDASRRRSRYAGARLAPGAPAHRAPIHDTGRLRRPCRGRVRERRAHSCRRTCGSRRHPLRGALRFVRSGAAPLHRLRRLSWLGTGRAPGASRSRSDVPGLDGARQTFRPLLLSEPASGQFRCDHRAGHLDA